MQLIVIAGQAQVGKTSLAHIIAKNAFAMGLIPILCSFSTKEFEKRLLSIRDEERKDIKDDRKYWERCVIVDDCRYPSEIEITLKYKGTLIFLSYGTRKPDDPDIRWRNHELEDMAKIVENSTNKELKNVFNYFIRNEESLEDLEEEVKLLVPIWCGVQPKNGRVITEYSEHAEDLARCIDELVDLLLLGEDLFSGIDEDEEDEDEDEEDT